MLRYKPYSALNGAFLVVLAVAGGLLAAWLLLSAGQTPEGSTVLPYAPVVLGLAALAAVVLAIGVYQGRPRATFVIAWLYLIAAAVCAVYAIAAFLVGEELSLRLTRAVGAAAGTGVAFALLAVLTRQIESGNAHVARRLRYGSRIEAAVLLVLAVVVIANYAGREKYVRADWRAGTGRGLSPLTVQLVKNLDEPVRLTSLYTVLEDVPESAQLKERLEKVKELFDEYQRINPQIEVAHVNPIKDKDKVRELLTRLKSIQAPEAKAHIELIEQFKSEDVPTLREVFQQEHDQAEPLGGAATDGTVKNLFDQIISAFGSGLEQLDQTDRSLQAVLESEIPVYTNGTNAIRTYCQNTERLLDSAIKAYREIQEKVSELDEPTRTFFVGGRARLGPVLARCRELSQQVSDLKSLESETLQFDLQQPNPVIVETADGVKVLSFGQIWQPVRSSPGPREEPRLVFAGEKAVSSAILALTQKEKAAIFFVHWGGPPPLGFRGQFSALAQELRDKNFDVEAWDIQAQEEPPVVENMSRAIWVILPPQPPPPTPEMPFGRPPQITNKQKDKIEHFLNSGGRALLMMTPSSAIMGPPSPLIPKLAEYGIKVNPEVVAIWGMPTMDGGVRPVDYVLVREYGNHPIVNDLGAYRSLFRRVVMLEPTEDEQGAAASVLASVPDEADYWGEKAHMAGSMGGAWVKDEDDLPGGFAIAMAGKKDESKVVVVGDYMWATDQITTARGGFLGLGGPQFPGNALLFLNAMYWLNDNEQMIAVPPEALQVARIGTMSDSAMWSWRAFAIAGLPLACLLAGGVVFLFRRA